MTASASPQQEQPNVYTLHIRPFLCDRLYYNYSIRPLYSNVSAFNKDQLLPSFCSMHYLALTLDYLHVHSSIKHYFQATENPHGVIIHVGIFRITIQQLSYELPAQYILVLLSQEFSKLDRSSQLLFFPTSKAYTRLFCGQVNWFALSDV